MGGSYHRSHSCPTQKERSSVSATGPLNSSDPFASAYSSFRASGRENFPPFRELFSGHAAPPGNSEEDDDDDDHHDDHEHEENNFRATSRASPARSSASSSMDMSIGAMAAMNEHIRHIARYGLDASSSSLEASVSSAVSWRSPPSSAEKANKAKSKTDRHVHEASPNYLDQAWESLLEGSSSDHDESSSRKPLSIWRQNCSDSSTVQVEAVLCRIDSEGHEAVEVQVRNSRVVDDDNEDDCYEEESSCTASAMEYFDGPRVWMLQTPERNRGFKLNMVGQRGDGDGGEGTSTQEETLTSTEVDDAYTKGSPSRQFANLQNSLDVKPHSIQEMQKVSYDKNSPRNGGATATSNVNLETCEHTRAMPTTQSQSQNSTRSVAHAISTEVEECGEPCHYGANGQNVCNESFVSLTAVDLSRISGGDGDISVLQGPDDSFLSHPLPFISPSPSMTSGGASPYGMIAPQHAQSVDASFSSSGGSVGNEDPQWAIASSSPLRNARQMSTPSTDPVKKSAIFRRRHRRRARTEMGAKRALILSQGDACPNIQPCLSTDQNFGISKIACNAGDAAARFLQQNAMTTAPASSRPKHSPFAADGMSPISGGAGDAAARLLYQMKTRNSHSPVRDLNESPGTLHSPHPSGRKASQKSRHQETFWPVDEHQPEQTIWSSSSRYSPHRQEKNSFYSTPPPNAGAASALVSPDSSDTSPSTSPNASRAWRSAMATRVFFDLEEEDDQDDPSAAGCDSDGDESLSGTCSRLLDSFERAATEVETNRNETAIGPIAFD